MIRVDGGLGIPLDARATNLLAADVGGYDGSFSGRHNGLRDLIYDEAARAGAAVRKEVEIGTEHGLDKSHVKTIRELGDKAEARRRKRERARPRDLAEACLKMRIDVTCAFPNTGAKYAGECKSVAWCKSYMQRRRGGKHIHRFGTTVDYIANKARQDRLDHVALIDREALGGQGTLASVVRKQGTLEGYAVGGCCDLSTSVHHLVDKLGEELGYIMAADTGWDVEDCIPCMTTGLKLRAAARIWRDYYKHAFARQNYADPSKESLAARRQERRAEEEERAVQERTRQQNFLAARSRNRARHDPRGMG